MTTLYPYIDDDQPFGARKVHDVDGTLLWAVENYYVKFHKWQHLWQTMGKQNLDPENTHQLTDEEWEEFFNDFQDGFAEEVSEIAKECFQNFLNDRETN